MENSLSKKVLRNRTTYFSKKKKKNFNFSFFWMSNPQLEKQRRAKQDLTQRKTRKAGVCHCELKLIG